MEVGKGSILGVVARLGLVVLLGVHVLEKGVGLHLRSLVCHG